MRRERKGNMNAYLILEDGTVYKGFSIGAKKEVISEIVFNTSMTGYLEILTDPSYAGQSVVMTYPLIGNYGVCYEDMESKHIWSDAVIVREASETFSNFRGEVSIEHFLKEQSVPGICGIDTRALTKRLREKGTMRGMITTNEPVSLPELLKKIKQHQYKNPVWDVTCVSKKKFGDKGYHVALMDFGSKGNIVNSLLKRGCKVTTFPADTKAEEIIAECPDGILLSNGPGNPKDCNSIIEQLKVLYQTDIPIMAICLGHQLMALATGADTRKMKYGHRGANHPVKELETGKVIISSQNHGYVVDIHSVDQSVAKESFVNVNDGSNEGLTYVGKNIYTVQFHPEASPGPLEGGYLFDRFINMMGGC